MKIKLLSSALEDLYDGRLFYEKQGEELGEYFYNSLFSDIDSLTLHAGIHPKFFGYYRMLYKRFPYAIYYKIGEGSLVVVWRVLDLRRNPKKIRHQESGIPRLFPQMTTEARHINDGMLRLIAILAELQSGHSFLLFDEIENGINPELVEFVIEALTSTDKQVLVTTHSPMILNYLSDEVAKSGVIYLYKTPIGLTKAIQFFSIPSIAEKLTVMGPGEVFVDTNLTDLTEEIQNLDAEAR